MQVSTRAGHSLRNYTHKKITLTKSNTEIQEIIINKYKHNTRNHSRQTLRIQHIIKILQILRKRGKKEEKTVTAHPAKRGDNGCQRGEFIRRREVLLRP